MRANPYTSLSLSLSRPLARSLSLSLSQQKAKDERVFIQDVVKPAT